MSAAPPTILIAGAGVVGLSVGRAARDRALRGPAARARARGARAAASGAPTRPICASTRCRERRSACSIRSARGSVSSRGARARIAACTSGKARTPPPARSNSTAPRSREPDLGHIVEDSLLRRALAEVLAAAPNAELAHGAGLESVDIDARAARVRLADGRAAQGTLLVAADGSESAIRGMLELPVAARSYGQTGARDARCDRAAAPRDGVAAVLAGRTARVPAARGRPQLGRLVQPKRARRAAARRASPMRSCASYRARARACSASSAPAARVRDSRCRRCTRAATARRARCSSETRRTRFIRSRAKA